MLIVIYALLSWMSIFDSGDVNDEIIKIKKEQDIENMNGDEKNRIVNNSFSNQTIDSYGLELDFTYNNMKKRKDYDVYSISPRMNYIDEYKKNKTWIDGSYIDKNQEFFIDVLDNAFISTIRIECKFNPSIEFKGEKN